jgi:hypothetical protein
MIGSYSLPGMYDAKSECQTPYNEGPHHIMHVSFKNTYQNDFTMVKINIKG